MSKVIVTGGTGYIGSHVAVDLINKGFEVIIIDDLSNSEISVLDGIEKITGTKPFFEKIDLCDKEATRIVFEKYSDIQGAIHFAASKAVGESVEQPIKYYKNNLQSLLNMIELMIEYKIDNFIFSSSCTVYGQPDILPVTEESPIKIAESPYGNTKQIGEEILTDQTKAPGNQMKFVCLRYFNPIGAHPTALIGEKPSGIPANLIPYITKTVKGELEQLTVFGDDYDTRDGTPIRDYIHVCDISSAHVLAFERLLNNANTENLEIYNLGSGEGHTVLEIINAFESSTGEKVNYKIGPRRAGDVIATYANNDKAKTQLGWKLKYTLQDMTRSAWAWEQKMSQAN